MCNASGAPVYRAFHNIVSHCQPATECLPLRVDNSSEQGQQRWILHADEYRRLRPLLIKHRDEEESGSSSDLRVFHRTGMETRQEVSNNLSYFDYWCSLNLVLCHWEGPACEGHKARRPCIDFMSAPSKDSLEGSL